MHKRTSKACPRCNSDSIGRIHRSWWMRLIRDARYYRCSSCGKKFLTRHILLPR